MTRNRQLPRAGLPLTLPALFLGLLTLVACETETDGEPAGAAQVVDTAGGDFQTQQGPGPILSGPVELAPIDHSGVSGTVEIDRGDEVAVTMVLEGLEQGVDYSAHIHDGRCATGGPVRIPFDSVAVTPDGTGSARLTARSERLPAEQAVFVQVHGSDGQAVACADLHRSGGDPTLMPEPDTTSGT